MSFITSFKSSFGAWPDEWMSTKTRSEQHVTESAVLASEIEQLPDLAGYLKLSSSPEWVQVRLSATGTSKITSH